MTVRLRLIALSVVALAGLVACDRDRPAATKAPATVAATPAEPAAPMNYESSTPYARVSLALPVTIRAQPELHASLYAKALNDLREFTEGAQADLSEAGSDGLRPYEKSIAVTPGAETGRLFSLVRTDAEDTGGAHPNAALTAVMWDKTSKREVAAADLFAPGGDLDALDAALCVAVNAEKKKRNPGAATVTMSGSEWTCPRAAATPFVLAPGDMPGKAGGLVFLIGPYQVGPYSEGDYRVVVPHAAFRALLAPAYAGEFAGAPTA